MTITLEYNGKEYKLGFTRASIKQMEQDGFNFMEAQSHPATLAFSLIEGAFHTYNPKMSEEKIYEIFDSLERREELVSTLMEMFQEPLAILKSPEGDEAKAKNVPWKVI